jgi:hypothetical protein
MAKQAGELADSDADNSGPSVHANHERLGNNQDDDQPTENVKCPTSETRNSIDPVTTPKRRGACITTVCKHVTSTAAVAQANWKQFALRKPYITLLVLISLGSPLVVDSGLVRQYDCASHSNVNTVLGAESKI